eukprot:TRINITY_DN120753_c0_g1_i1.p1 TRINITY_DN120753_c0_g1~~TRINITY_DN120753_c0_g1_i1.p1  ORF type:complete len:646 (+),score=69.62 TRINITY_DN120753_c0_g1_i1:121-2058(+)
MGDRQCMAPLRPPRPSLQNDADSGPDSATPTGGATGSAAPVLISPASTPIVTKSSMSLAWKTEDSMDGPDASLFPLREGDPQHWDYYMCHKQSNGQDATLLLQTFLAEKLPGVRCWIDIEQDPTEQGMHEGVRNCQNFLLFLTAEVFKSKWVLLELEWALQYKKNIVLVLETDERHGKPVIEDLRKGLPSKFSDLFHTNVAIPFLRDPEFREVSLNKIIRASDLARHRRMDAVPHKEKKTPLMFKSKKWHEEDEIVFDSWFVTFTTVCGIALPGSDARVRRWSHMVQTIILLCGLACASRLFTTEGPAYMDRETILQIVVAHPVIFVYLHVTLSVLDSHCVRDMLENHIDATRDAKRIRCKVRVATVLSILLTFALTCWAWVAYLPGFFNHWYFATSERSSAWAVFGISHGAIWVVVLPLFFGSLFCCLLMMFIIQELAYMNIVTCFSQLDTRVRDRGLHSMLERNETLSLSYQSLYRFQIATNAAYQRYRRLHQLAAPAYIVFWLIQAGLLPWSIRSLMKGVQAAQGEEEMEVAERMQEHWFLVVRMTFFSGGGLFFGIPQWIVALQPWGSHHYAWCLHWIRSRIVVTQTDMLPVFMTVLDRVDARFRVGLLHTDFKLMPLYLAILAVNTAGWNAYAARLFCSL